MPKLKHPSLRAQQYVKYYAQGLTRREAALKAGYSESVARNPGRAIHMQPGVLFLLYKNISPRAKIWGLSEGIAATKLEVFPVYKVTEMGYEKIRGLYRVVEVEDHKTRLKYLELTFKALGWLR